jgi:hypothetical protein
MKWLKTHLDCDKSDGVRTFFSQLALGSARDIIVPCQLMNYLKGILSGLAAIIIAELVPGPWSPFRFLGDQRATGLAAVMGELLESFFSPLFWVLVIALFAIFFAASRLNNTPLRVVFFWIPALTSSGLALAVASLLAYVIIRFRSS